MFYYVTVLCDDNFVSFDNACDVLVSGDPFFNHLISFFILSLPDGTIRKH
jgi:hypothetical protein